MTINFSETGGATLYGDARYDADKLLDYLRRTRENIGTLRHDFEMFHIDGVLGLDVSTAYEATAEYDEFCDKYLYVDEELSLAEDYLVNAINLIEGATQKLRKMPRYNALDKETQELKAKERSYM